jgi:phosphopantothenoylcysteine decarboxylase/phosphopantothenate--cysteine ligase
METENLIENSKKKLDKKNADMICANTIGSNKTGFKADTNQITLITKNETVELPFDTKDNLANMILDKIITL